MTPSAYLLTTSLLAGLALAVHAAAADPAAAPPAADNATPEAAKTEPAAEPAKPDAEAKAPAKPFIGLGTSDVPGFLGKHLKLPDNAGVLVRDLAPDGPAAKAGITIDDVITTIDGKAVSSHQEMVDHILTKQPGDPVELQFIHEGTPGKVTVKLGERPAVLDPPQGQGRIEAEAGAIQLPELPGNIPPEMQKQLRDALKNGLKAGQMKLQIIPGAGGLQVVPGGQDGGDAGNGFKFDMASSINLMDDQGSIELKKTNDGSEVKVRDKAGKETWSGPWDTEQDKAAAPPEIRERIERMNVQVMPGLKMKMNAEPEEPQDQPADKDQPAEPEAAKEETPAKP